MACLDVDIALDFVQGRLGEKEIEVLEEHVDQCDRCRLLLAEGTRAFRARETVAVGPGPGAAPAAARAPFTRLVPGDILSGRYRIVRFIARGGMGEVYEAEDSILNTRLALKTLAATISDDPHAIRRLKQEVNLARRITHPNVCRIFDLGVHGQASSAAMPGQLFITMELVAGRSLGQRLRTGGRLAPREAAHIVRSLVAALGAAHRAHVVHRDFKSDNVMLAPEQGSEQGSPQDGQEDGQEDGQDRVVVMDFGLARAALAADSSSIDGHSLAGTLPYMSPEQLQGRPVGPATDIYALGVVIFEMLTGQLPFKDEPPLAAAWRRVAEPPPPLGSLVAGLDPGWERLVAACLECEPARRPASADEVSKLMSFIDVGIGVGVGTAPQLHGGPSRGFWTRPRQYALGASAILALAGLGRLGRLARSPVPGPPASPPAISVGPPEMPPFRKVAPQPEPTDEMTLTTPPVTAVTIADSAPRSRAGDSVPVPQRRSTSRGRVGLKRGELPPRLPSQPENPGVMRSAPSPEAPPAPPAAASGSEIRPPTRLPRSKDPNDGFATE